MLNSTYNLNRLGSPSAGDLINTSVFDAVGGSSNYFKPSLPFNMYDPNLAYNPLASTTMPRRRYSIGGLPTASSTDLVNLQQQTADVHLSNLLNEAKTSITRSSQILSRGEDLTGDILLSAAAGDVIADLSHKHIMNNDIDITSANILNQMPITYSSQPNIFYAQPNYTNSQMPADMYMSRFRQRSAATPFGGGGSFSGGGGICGIGNTASASALNYPLSTKSHLTNPILTAYTNPYFNSNMNTIQNYNVNCQTMPYQSYQQPSYHQSTTYNPKYNQPPPPYSSVLSSQVNQPPNTYHHYHRPMHYTSNPVISQSSNYYFKHPHQTFHTKLNTNPNQSMIAQTATSASYLHHQNQHPYSGYSNQQFDHMNNSNCYSKLDLVDYTKQSEQTKRQVSFNIDVDTLSITS